MTAPFSRRLLLPLLALLITIPTLVSGLDSLATLLPLWALAGYAALRQDRVLSWSLLELIFAALALIVIGMVWGPLQSNLSLNHLSHGLIALGLTAILASELALRETRSRAGILAVVIAVALGIDLEIAEMVIRFDISALRLVDTVADLGADLIGAIAGACLWYYWTGKQGLDQRPFSQKSG